MSKKLVVLSGPSGAGLGDIAAAVFAARKDVVPVVPVTARKMKEGEKDGVLVEVALQHNEGYNESTYSFVNNIVTPEGGTHMTGFRNALTKTFNDYGRSNKLLKDSEQNLTGDDIREGLTAIISIKIGEPQFEGQTKQKLGNSEARGAVESIMTDQLSVYLE